MPPLCPPAPPDACIACSAAALTRDHLKTCAQELSWHPGAVNLPAECLDSWIEAASVEVAACNVAAMNHSSMLLFQATRACSAGNGQLRHCRHTHLAAGPSGP